LENERFPARIADCMAKKGAREIVAMICSVCKSQNYVTQRNKVNMATKSEGSSKLNIKKWCKNC